VDPLVHEKDNRPASLDLVLDDDLVLGLDGPGLEHADGQGAALGGKGGQIFSRFAAALDHFEPDGGCPDDHYQADHTHHFECSVSHASGL